MDLTQIGMGGLIALLLTREVLAFLKNRNGRIAEQTVTGEYHRVLSEVFQQTIVPLLTTQTQILTELRILNEKIMRSLAILLDRMDQHRAPWAP